MSEHHPDMDLIMTLAAGDLPPEEAARVEAGLDDEARAELAAQRAALGSLQQLPRPTLSTAERERLRTAVRTELRLEATPTRAVRPRPARSWLARALPALAALASLVVVLAIALDFGDMFGSESEPTFDAPATTGAATTAAPATTTVAASTTLAPAAAPVTAAAEEEAMMEEPSVAADEVAAEEAEAMAEEALAAAKVVAAEEEEAMAEEASSEADMVALEEEEAMPAATTTTTAAAAIESTDTTAPPDVLPIAFDFSTARPSHAVGVISAAIAEGVAVPFPISDLVEQAESAGLACGDIAGSGSAPDDTVYFMAHGLVDGEEAEVYLILEDEAGRDETDSAVTFEAGDLLLLSRPTCETLAFST